MRITYNISPVLRDSLNRIEQIRQKILTTPLSPLIELRLKWEAMIDRIYWSMALREKTISRNEIVKILTKHGKREIKEEEKLVLKYKNGMDYIAQNWLASSDPVSPKTAVELHKRACEGDLNISEEKLKEPLNYLQANPENPVIQAATIYIQFASLKPFSRDNELITQLMSYLFLYKLGYDFRGLLVLEEYWKRDLGAQKDMIETTLITEGLTLWITYFSKAVISQLEKVSQNLSSPDFKLDYLPSFFWEISGRQKEILSILDEPKKTITNRDVQKLFKVSQITASRDLAKLASLGLLFSYGKGRSVKYAKV